MEKLEKINDDISLFSQEGSLDFGTDAYLLSAFLRKNTKYPSAELGCGNGVITLLATARKKLGQTVMFDIQSSLCAVAAKNVELNRMGDKITVVNADIKNLDAKYNGVFGTVFANPPYLKADGGAHSEDESADICRREIKGGISDFAVAAAKLLRHGGYFTCVYRPDRLAEMLCAMRQAKLEPKRLTLVYPTLSHAPCLALCEAKKGADEGLFMTAPLVIYEARDKMTQSGYTEDMKKIYESGDFDERFKNPGK
ncbi:MAG: methyltransferase [Clostridia bacterium]|nr:methyltransferase [Clostridia bacterium]